MKSIHYPFTLTKQSSKHSEKFFTKKTVYYLALVGTGLGGIFIPMSLFAFFILIMSGAFVYCHQLYKEISALDFSSDNYSITLDEIIEDLEG